jgi:phosphoribosylformylglycinamidine synthase PurS subunit
LKFSVKVTLKKDVLDPQGKVVHQTLQNMGMNTIKNLRQGKYFEIELEEEDELKAKNKIENMCKKLLVNLIIEITKI